MTELNQIKEIWVKRYPDLSITLRQFETEGRILGILIRNGNSQDISANTISELINNGEKFLRTSI